MERKPAGIDTLTSRQKEILRLIAKQYQTKEIARLLDISERTVKTHTEEIRRRLGVASSRDAARLLVAHEALSEALPQAGQEGAAIGREDRGATRPMAENPDTSLASPHEQTRLSASIAPDDPLGPAGNSLAPGRGAGEAGLDPRHTGGYPEAEHDQRPGDGTVRPDRGDRLVDRRRGSLEYRLARLNAFQWLGLIVVVGVLSAILVSGLIAAVIGTLEGLQVLNRQIR
ncbi:MAG: LuxR family transcriptional regulator [Asticcacaulis sp.]|uniref:LuxR family transcriptional regulator n=1 Tax=Asticcacaulis sp. TaxID=1872648 RepID=UPI0039E59365